MADKTTKIDIPDVKAVKTGLLEAIANGRARSFEGIDAAVARKLGLSKEQRDFREGRSRSTLFEKRLAQARTELVKAGSITFQEGKVKLVVSAAKGSAPAKATKGSAPAKAAKKPAAKKPAAKKPAAPAAASASKKASTTKTASTKKASTTKIASTKKPTSTTKAASTKKAATASKAPSKAKAATTKKAATAGKPATTKKAPSKAATTKKATTSKAATTKKATTSKAATKKATTTKPASAKKAASTTKAAKPTKAATATKTASKGNAPKGRPTKCLSFQEPFASYVVTGVKDAEFRSNKVNAPVRDVVVCAAKTTTAYPEKIPGLAYGMAIGMVDIVECVGGDGDYVWKLENPRLIKPFEVSAKAGFFYVADIPERIANTEKGYRKSILPKSFRGEKKDEDAMIASLFRPRADKLQKEFGVDQQKYRIAKKLYE